MNKEEHYENLQNSTWAINSLTKNFQTLYPASFVASSVPEIATRLGHSALSLQKIQTETRQQNALNSKGLTAQIESAESLTNMQTELRLVAEGITSLLNHTMEQSNQQAAAFRLREKVEARNFDKAMLLARIAAWTGVISTIVGIASLTR